MRVVICAGEASGDILGAGLIAAIREQVPEAVFEGIAGPRMQAEGCSSVYPMERLSVMGLVEVAGRYLEILPKRRQLARRFVADAPDVFIGIDAPDFNLGLEAMVRRAGIPTVHYVSPSVWAWREYRLRGIRRSVDRMLVLFPFEKRYYRERGIHAVLVGHHLADTIPEHVDRERERSELGLDQEGPMLALLPGSRMSEVLPLSGILVRTAAWLHARRPGLRFIVPLASPRIRSCFEAALWAQAPAGAASLRRAMVLIDGQSRRAMAASDVVLLASGTATLEAALLQRPMVITYRTHPLTWAIGRRMLKVPHVGLPNLLAGEEVVPELLQNRARPSMLGATVASLLDSPQARQRQLRHFSRIHRSLRLDASRRAAGAVLDLCNEMRGRPSRCD